MKPIFYFAPLLLFALVSSPARAGSSCSIDRAYPEVAELRVEGGTLVAILGTHFANPEMVTWPNGQEAYRLNYPRLSMSDQEQWQLEGYGEAPSRWEGTQEGCFSASDDPEKAWMAAYGSLSKMRNAEGDWFDESISSCTTVGDATWGGISFYGAEGGWGIGGLAKKDLQTGDVEFLRPHRLIGGSTGPVAHFAGYLWIGMTWFGECSGPSPGVGMKRLGTQRGREYHRVYEVPEVCGFAVRDFQEFQGALWAATELGLSKLVDEDGPKWTNYVPDLNDPMLLREVSCDDLYAELLESREFADTKGFDMGYAFDVFWDRLTKFRPNFTRRYLRKLHGHKEETGHRIGY